MAEIQATFNPTVLFNLLVGSAGAAGRRNTGPILTSIRSNLRNEIESALPVIYLYDAEVIVDSMLTALQPTAVTASDALKEERLVELSKYVSSIATDEGLFALPEVSVVTKNGKKTKLVIPGDPGAYDAFISAYNTLLADRATLIDITFKAIDDTVKQNTIGVNELTSAIADIHARLQGVVREITSLGLPISSKQDARFTRVIRAAGRAIRQISTKVKKVSDPETLISDYKANSQVLIYAQNFNAAKTAINANITKQLASYLNKAFNIVTRSATTGFQAGNFSAAGHVGFVSEGLQNINTPQLQAANLILAQAGKDAPGLIDKFISSTGHSQWLIKVNKQQGENLNKVLSLGISLVRSQPSVFNSGVLAPQEVSIINKEIETLLGQSYNDALEELQKQAANNTNFHKYLIDTYRMSPTIKEGVASLYKNVFEQTKALIIKGSKSGTTSNKIANIKSSLGGSSTKSKGSKSSKKASTVPRPKTPPVTTNLIKLQNIINQQLQDVVAANMGNGSSRTVLNYRTGRLAASVSLDRLTQSRDGMITAFYSYMKNPYATFSDGGKQQVPRSRDPKLLISKSIREIAAEQAVTRMRAVAV